MMLSRATIVALLSLVGLAAAADTTFTWTVKTYEAMTAEVGDTFTFDWSGTTHDLSIHPTGDCSDAIRFSTQTQGPASYTFTATDAGKSLFFACDIADHCEAGQHVTVTVAPASTPGDTVSPTDAPVETTPADPVSPTDAPVETTPADPVPPTAAPVETTPADPASAIATGSAMALAVVAAAVML